MRFSLKYTRRIEILCVILVIRAYIAAMETVAETCVAVTTKAVGILVNVCAVMVVGVLLCTLPHLTVAMVTLQPQRQRTRKTATAIIAV